MRFTRFVVVMIAVFALLVTSLIPLSRVSAANLQVSKGDFWEYQSSLGGLEPNLIASEMTVRIEVMDKLSLPVFGTTVEQEVWRVGVSSSGTATYKIGGINYSSAISISGYMDRLTSNFSTADTSLVVKPEVGLPVSFGTNVTLFPPLHDYIGTDELAVGTTVTSTSAVNATTWSNIVFKNETFPLNETVELTLTVQRVGVQVTVPAGVFSCVEVRAESKVGANVSVGTWYYSTVVGNYVEFQGAEASFASVLGANANLTAYSHHTASFSLFKGTGLIILAIVIIAIVAVIVSGVWLRRRKGGLAQTTPPPHVEPEPTATTPKPPPAAPKVPPPGPHQHEQI